jgi:glycyl-tRNA synthetase beta chain
MQDALLIELLTEELPPKSLQALADAFAERVFALLNEDGLAIEGSRYETFATPRRLAVLIDKVGAEANDKPITLSGPPVSAALDKQGKPTPALIGFAKKCGVGPEQLRRAQGEKGEVFVCDKVAPGAKLATALESHVADAVRKLPIPKVMRWGDSDTEFVRPVHGLIMLHGTRIVPGKVLGLEARSVTRGHRFLSRGEVRIPTANEYARTLEAEGAVVASFAARAARIREQLLAAAGKATLGDFEPLLSEVTALVENPTVYEGRFDAAFLEVPQECLILSMKQHQKYFPLLDAQSGKLLDRFLIVSNMRTDDPSDIIAGNERVLRARLADAKFFYDQDRKTRLADRVERLASVVYHNKLGSQLERVQRIRKLAGAIAEKLHADVANTERAAWLAKADLVSDMVGEFPELQGVMGQYYALHDDEDAAVARAIEAHYHPRFANDSLPEDNVGAAVALADKLDTLVGIYGIGLTPSGDRDPFGLRRQALGVLRILSERALPLDLLGLLQLAKLNFSAGVLSDSVAVDLHLFILDRLRNYLRERNFAIDEIEAVVSQNPTRIDQVVPRLQAVQTFRAMPEAESLAAANKRIRNILKKTKISYTGSSTVKTPETGSLSISGADPALFQEAAERNLFAATAQLAPVITSLSDNQDYTEALRTLAGVRSVVDTFFDEVMVMAEEPVLRNNRLALLAQLEALMNRVADISKLAG